MVKAKFLNMSLLSLVLATSSFAVGNGMNLFTAAEAGNLEQVKLLLEDNADVNLVDNYGSTALHWAARKGCLDVVQFLLANGADVKAKNNFGWTVLHLAASNGHFNVVKELLKVPGIDVNLVDNCGWIALHWAARNGRLDVVNVLLANGGEMNAKDNEGCTALHWAARNGHIEVVKLLLQVDCIDVNLVNNDGDTALYRAARKGRLEVVKLLLENGATLDATNDEDVINGLRELLKEALANACNNDLDADIREANKNFVIKIRHCDIGIELLSNNLTEGEKLQLEGILFALRGSKTKSAANVGKKRKPSEANVGEKRKTCDRDEDDTPSNKKTKFE